MWRETEGHCCEATHGSTVMTRAVSGFLISASVGRGHPVEIKGSQAGASGAELMVYPKDAASGRKALAD